MEKKYNNRNLLILLGGQFLSVFCTFMYDFAISLFVLDMGRTNMAYSIIMVLGMGARIVVNLFAGVFVDKSNKKYLIVGCDILSGMVVCIAFFMFISNHFTYLFIILITILLNSLNAMFGLSFMSAVPELFKGEKMIVAGNSISQMVQAVSAILGPIVGSLLYLKFGLGIILILNIASFIVTGIWEMFLKYYKSEKKQEKERYLTSLGNGYRYIWKNKNLKNLCVFYIIFQTIVAPLLTVLLPIVVYNDLKLSSISLGMIQAAYAVGVLVGAGLASTKKDIYTILRKFFYFIKLEGVLIALWCIIGVPFILNMGNTIKTIIFSILVFLMSVVNMYLTIPLITYFQEQIPENMRGKLFGVITTALTIGTPVGGILLGIFSDIVNWTVLVVMLGSLLIITAFLFGRKIVFNGSSK